MPRKRKSPARRPVARKVGEWDQAVIDVVRIVNLHDAVALACALAPVLESVTRLALARRRDKRR